MNETYSAARSFLSVVANTQQPPHDENMSDAMTRHEVTARLEATEARVAASLESMRAEMTELRADLRGGIAEIRAQGERAQVNADRFYAEAGKVLAEIRLANSEHKVGLYGAGYKVITWTLGTILALIGVSFGAYRALLSAGLL